jgi:hypothetical protein
MHEALAPHRSESSRDYDRQLSLAHQASARLNTLAAAHAALSVADSSGRRRKARPIDLPATAWGSGYLAMPCLETVPGNKSLGPDATRAKTAPQVRRAARAGREGFGKALASSSHNRRYRRCTGRLNATQPGVICRQPSVHTWIGPPVQASRRRVATPHFIHKKGVKFPLTPWSYLGKRARSEARIRWRAAQITLIRSDAGCCALQHLHV